jgi:hypothetical protein
MKRAALVRGRAVEKVVIILLLLVFIEIWLWLELVDR